MKKYFKSFLLFIFIFFWLNFSQAFWTWDSSWNIPVWCNIPELSWDSISWVWVYNNIGYVASYTDKNIYYCDFSDLSYWVLLNYSNWLSSLVVWDDYIVWKDYSNQSIIKKYQISTQTLSTFFTNSSFSNSAYFYINNWYYYYYLYSSWWKIYKRNLIDNIETYLWPVTYSNNWLFQNLENYPLITLRSSDNKSYLYVNAETNELLWTYNKWSVIYHVHSYNWNLVWNFSWWEYQEISNFWTILNLDPSTPWSTSYTNGFDWEFYYYVSSTYFYRLKVDSGSSSSPLEWKTCEVRTINYEYPIYDDFSYWIEYTWDNQINLTTWSPDYYDVYFDNIKDFTWSLKNVINSTWTTFSFYGYTSPFSDNPTITIEKDLIDTITLTATWDIQEWTYPYYELYNENWSRIKDDSWTIEFEYWKKYNLSEYNNKLTIIFPIEWLWEITIGSLYIWNNDWFQLVDTLICKDEETEEILYWFDTENLSDLEVYSWSVYDIWKILPDSKDIFEDNPFFIDTSTWSIEFWSINYAIWDVWDTCDMFSENWAFLFNSNWTITVSFVPDWFDVIWVWWLLTQFENLVNNWITSLSSIVTLVTPFSLDSEWKKYCLLWTVMTFENHKLFKDTEYYNEMTMIDYLILFWYFSWILWIILTYRWFVWPPHNELSSESVDETVYQPWKYSRWQLILGKPTYSKVINKHYSLSRKWAKRFFFWKQKPLKFKK